MPEPLGGGGIVAASVVVLAAMTFRFHLPRSPPSSLLTLLSISSSFLFLLSLFISFSLLFYEAQPFFFFFFLLFLFVVFFLSLRGSSPDLEWDLDRLGPGRVWVDSGESIRDLQIFHTIGSWPSALWGCWSYRHVSVQMQFFLLIFMLFVVLDSGSNPAG